MSSWGQLGYTSSSGGFGIHAEVGLDLPERDVLAAGASAYAGRGSFGQDLPLLADPEQAKGFHRSLTYRLVDGVGGCYWHSAPAGPDESGRTGNCFVHALVDKAVQVPGAVDGRPWRPVEGWRSTSMVAPFGSAAVKAATLPELPPEPGPVATRAEVIAFLTSFEVDRLGTFYHLVKACAVPRRTPLILGVGTPDEGALWVAGLTYLMSPDAASEFTFSIWEAPELLARDRVPEVELICVEETRIPPSLADLGLDVMRTSQPEPADIVDPDDVPSVIADLSLQLFSLGQDQILARLLQVDEVSSTVRPDPQERVWPLAMVMALGLAEWPHMEDTITRLLQQVTPPTIDRDRELWTQTQELINERTGRSGAELTELLKDVQSAAPGAVQRMLHQAYVQQAARRTDWYADEARRGGSLSPAPPLDGDTSSEWFREAVRLAAPAVEEPDRNHDIDSAVTLVQLMDFLLAEGWNDVDGLDSVRRVKPADADDAPGSESETAERTDEVASAFVRLGEVLVPKNVQGEGAAGDKAMADAFLGRLGCVSDRCRELVVQPQVEAVLREDPCDNHVLLGHRVPPAVLEWLVPIADVAKGTVRPSLEDPLGSEVLAAYLTCPEGQQVVRTAVDVLTARPAYALPSRTTREVLRRLAPHRLTSAETQDLLRIYGDEVPPNAIFRSLAGAGDELSALARDVGRYRASWAVSTVSRDMEAAARALLHLVDSPLDYLRHPDGIDEAARRGNDAMDALRGFSPEDSEVLSVAWAPYFDLLTWVTDPTGWVRKRSSLFGPDAPVLPSTTLMSELIQPPRTRHDADFDLREEVTHRLIFNAWFASHWPERVAGRQRTARPTAPGPAQSAVENRLRDLDRYASEPLLGRLLDNIEFELDRRFGPSLPEQEDGREMTAWLKSAEDWFTRAAGATGVQKLGAMMKGMRRKK